MMPACADVDLGASLRLWQLISPTLPVGAYSYSGALEQVIESGDVRNETDAAAWIDETLREGLARTDLPILLRVQRALAAGDGDRALGWCRTLVAMRETSELRFADRSLGEALIRLLRDLGVPVPDAEAGAMPFAGAFAVAAAHWSLPAAAAAAGYAWSWCESQAAAAVKLVPLGHTAGQRLMLAAGPSIEAAVSLALRLEDDEIGYGMPGLAIASARHETQYTRLFRS